MNPDLDRLMAETEAAMHGARNGYRGPLHVGVDLGTAYTVLLVLDDDRRPLAGAARFADVVRDGLVVDFIGAIDLLRDLKREVEARLGVELAHAATGYPPGVPRVEVRATANVLRGAGFECTAEIDEPSAANAVLQVGDGAVVDVGGGTTGIAVLREGRVIYTADEPTGGTHVTLVIAGALNLSFEEAERLKTDARQHARLFPLVRPVMEKVGTIVARHIQPHGVNTVYLVGGACEFTGMASVIAEVAGVQAIVPTRPLFVTPLGIAMQDGSVSVNIG